MPVATEIIYAVLGICICIVLLCEKEAILSYIDYYKNEYSSLSWFFIRLIIVYILYQYYPWVPSVHFTAPISFLHTLPFFHPILINQVFQDMMRKFFVVLLLLFLGKVKPRIVIPFITVIYIVNAAASMSYGRIYNGTHIVAQLLLIVSLYHLFVQKKFWNDGHLFFLCYFVISLYYFLPFTAKAYNQQNLAWINPVSLRLWTLMKVYDHYGDSGTLQTNFLQNFLISYPLLALASSAIAMMTEGLGCVVVFMKNHAIKLIILGALTTLHLMIWGVMDIPFNENILLLSGFFLVELTLLVMPFIRKLFKRYCSKTIMQPTTEFTKS